jgi:hypothetical protein
MIMGAMLVTSIFFNFLLGGEVRFYKNMAEEKDKIINATALKLEEKDKLINLTVLRLEEMLRKTKDIQERNILIARIQDNQIW